MNTSVDSTKSEDSESFDGQYALLEAKGCSIDVLRRYADNGTRAEHAAVARNPDLPEDLRAKLTSDHFLRRDQAALEEIAERQDDEVVRDFVNMYAGTSRPFCAPKFLPFDRKMPEHRIADQVFCGFPFTSAEFPWPIEKLGDHMQPIAQINLTNASSLLGLKLGSGLLQLWGGIDSLEKVELQLRLVPESALSSALDWFYPDRTPWLDKSYGFDGCAHSAIEPMDFQPFSVDCCRIDWRPPQRMFYPNVGKRVFDPRIDERLKHDYYDRWDEFDAELEQLEQELDAACISRHSSFQNAWGEKPLVFLGGYAQAIGSAWDSYPDNMLFYHSLDYACLMTVGVTYRLAKKGAPKFQAHWTSDN